MMKLKQIRRICMEISQNLIINLVQKLKKIRKKKGNSINGVNALYKGREFTLIAFKSEIFLVKATKDEGCKILTPKQMFEKLPLALA